MIQNSILNDCKIVQSVPHNFNDTPSLEEIEDSKEKISSALETSLSFSDKQQDVTFTKINDKM